MSKRDNLESLNKISSSVSKRDKEIWENEAHSVCIKKATEELDKEIKRMENASTNLQKENAILETRLSEISDSIAVQKQTLKTCEQSLLVHRSLKESLIQRRDEIRKNYDSVLQMYEDEYQDYRSIYINNSKGYKDLRQKQIKLKKLKIVRMDLEVKIANLQKIRQQFQSIQNQILRSNIVKFAKFYVLYHKNKRVHVQLQELKNEEKKLMKQHLELVKLVKEKQQAKNSQERKQKQMIDSNINKKSSEEKTQPLKENKNLIDVRLQKFLQEEIKHFSLTSLGTALLEPRFNKEKSKVRLLDMKVVKPPSSQNQMVKKSEVELRKKMETIIETTRKSALRTGSRQAITVGSQEETDMEITKKNTSRPSSKQVTPTGSQQSQHDNTTKKTTTKVSQNSQEKSLSPKDNVHITPILKKTEPVQTSIIETNVASKDENISKFFTSKKKSVTFQNESILKTSQEEKQVRETENKFIFQNDNKNKEIKKENSTNLFPFGISKENVKPVELKSMDVFRKPFTFTSETIARQEKIQCDNFLKNPSFGMFTRQHSGEKKTDTPETQTIGNLTSSAGFTTGLESSDKQTSEESTFDPFETSFNPNNFNHSLLNTTQDFGQAPESNTTFNFFGSQNKNNLFTMF